MQCQQFVALCEDLLFTFSSSSHFDEAAVVLGTAPMMSKALEISLNFRIPMVLSSLKLLWLLVLSSTNTDNTRTAVHSRL
jgi:hypothetical protein